MEDGREEYTDWQEFANQCTENLELLEPTDLYNLLQQSTVYSNLSDPNFLLLIGKVVLKKIRSLPRQLPSTLFLFTLG